MLTRSKRSSTITDKEKSNITLIPIKKEIKTEQEEVTGVSHAHIQKVLDFLPDAFFSKFCGPLASLASLPFSCGPLASLSNF